jgi:hypothetical protein
MWGGATSDYSGNHTKMPKILLNGNNVCMVSWLAAASILGGRDTDGLSDGCVW